MKKLIYHIMRRIPGILLVVLAVASAEAQKPVQHIVVSRHDTIEFSVVEWDGDRYTWAIYDDPDLNFALDNASLGPTPYFVDGMYEGSSVKITNLDPGLYFIRVMVWDEVNCTNNLLLFSLEIEDVPEADIYGAEACFGDITYLRIVFTGVGPWDIIYTDGMENHHVNGISEQEYYHEIQTNTLEPNDEVIIKEYWISYINDVKIESSEPSDTARIIIYPIPSNSEIYIKEEEGEYEE
jgi:hypothetical protein